MGGSSHQKKNEDNKQLDTYTSNESIFLRGENSIQTSLGDKRDHHKQQTLNDLYARRVLAEQEKERITRLEDERANISQQKRIATDNKNELGLSEKQKISQIENWKTNINTLKKPNIPKNKSDFASMPKHLKSYNDFYNNLISLSGITQNIVNAAMRVFTQEGFLNADPKNGAVAGIIKDTLEGTFKESRIPIDTPSKDLTIAQRVAIYVAHFNMALKEADGVNTFDKIPDETGHLLIADMVFRNGKSGTGKIIQDAINMIEPGTFNFPEEEPRTFGKETMYIFNAMLANPKLRNKFLNFIADLRTKKFDESWRNDPLRD
jgi:hypothetical protein